MICQSCRAQNPDEEEFCHRCHQKLLVLSGGAVVRDDSIEDLEEEFSFDEHLLERISILEEALKRTTETVQHLLGVVRNQQEGIALTEAGVATARELLERQGIVEPGGWEDTWHRHRTFRLLALEKRERFRQQRDKIRTIHRGGRGDDLDRCLEEAEMALSVLDLEEALVALERAFELDERNHELACFLGETLFNAGETVRALAYFDRLLELKPDHYEGLVFGGVLRHEHGNPEGAAELLERAAGLYPDSFLPHFSLGAMRAGQGDAGGALVALERAVAIDPAPQALFLLGRCCQELGRVGRAIHYLRGAVSRHPGFEEAHYQLGLAYLDRRWNRKALESFRQAQRLNPRKFHYRELVLYLSDRGGPPLPSASREVESALARGERALQGDDPEVAYRCFRSALEVAPEDPTLLTYYALACLALDRGHEIESVVRRVAAGRPGEMLLATAYAAWIEALRSQGRLIEGNRVGRQLLETVESNVSRTIAYYEMAWNLAEMEEDLEEALELAKRALELAPEELAQFPLAALGWVHYKRREFAQAVDYLARAAELGTTSSNLTHLGMALLAAGDEDQARRVLDRARTLRSHGSGVEFKMMECLRDSNRFYTRLRREGED